MTTDEMIRAAAILAASIAGSGTPRVHSDNVIMAAKKYEAYIRSGS